MELPAREFSDDVTVPDRCRGCAHLQNIERAYGVFADEYDEIVKMYFDGNINEFLIGTGVEMGMSMDEAVRAVLHDPASTHQAMSQATEELADLRDRAARVARKLVECCPGTLKMRAAKAGRQVTVTVCMSEAMEGLGRLPVEPVRVVREQL